MVITVGGEEFKSTTLMPKLTCRTAGMSCGTIKLDPSKYSFDSSDERSLSSELANGAFASSPVSFEQLSADPYLQVFTPGSLWIMRGNTIDVINNRGKILVATILLKVNKYAAGDNAIDVTYKVLEYHLK